jgi:glycosyltransferase involved in cell wall biosynthesis
LIHDVISFQQPGTSDQRVASGHVLDDLRYVISRATQILTNSEFTRDDILRFVARGILPEPRFITATPLAHQIRHSGDAVGVRGPEEPYLLSVGGMPGYKNLEVVLEALARLRERGDTGLRLVLAGARRREVEELLLRERYRDVAEAVVRVVDPNQDELVELYRGALALVVPSRIEGWGLPLGEALWLGTPVVASDVGALREAGGELPLFFDPDDPGELADQLQRLHRDSAFRESLRQRIAAARSSLRSWRQVANDLVAAVGSAPG